MAASTRLLVEALRVGDMRRVLAAYLGFSVAEMANFIAILIYAYEVGGSPALGLVAPPTRPGRPVRPGGGHAW